MKKVSRLLPAALSAALLIIVALLGACTGKNSEEAKNKLADGVYTADFKTDNSMFGINEACDGKGTLTVKKGEMSIHISLKSKNIVNLFYGLAEDANKDGAALLMPTVDTVTYSDGLTEEVYGFDVPVPAIDEEYDVALIGKKGKWYDHKVSVSNPVPISEQAEKNEAASQAEKSEQTAQAEQEADAAIITDGVYTAELDFEGGSGKAKIISPAVVKLADGKITAVVEWSSPNYDYMLVDGQKYLPVNEDGNSVFEIPVTAFDEPVTVIGDTVAMSKPHEIEYTLTFHSDSLKPVE